MRLPLRSRQREREDRCSRRRGRTARAESDRSGNAVAHAALHSLRFGRRLANVKIVIILFIIAIVGSLGSALFYLMTDKGKTKRTVRALAIRVGLSRSEEHV